jgi:hypothetical protein
VSDKQCESITASEAGGEKNPNFLAIDGVNLGTLDCSFKDGTPKPKTIAHNQQCNAAKGYDGPTGIGTPKSIKFFKPSSLKPTISTKGKVEAKKTATFIAGGKDPFPGGKFTKYHWNFGDGHTSGGHKATHKYKKSGHYTVTLKVTDNYGQTAKVSQKIKVH